MRSKALAIGVTVMAMAMAVASCGGPDYDTTGRQEGRTFGTEAWYEVSFGASGTELVVRFDGPAATTGEADDDCLPERDVYVEANRAEVRVTVKRFAPSPVVTCPVVTQTMTAELSEPLGERPLVNPQTGWQYRVEDGRLVLDPSSTPCGRDDCSKPAVAKASCDPTEYGPVVDEQLRPQTAAPDADVRCDGSFLVMTRNGWRAWFVNRAASWKLVTRDQATCEDVWRAHRIRFPEPLCR